MSEKNLIIITKIILFYSFFFVGLRIFAIFQEAWLYANLILCIPFVLLAVLGIVILRSKKYSWAYVIIGIIVIGVTRYFERDWVKAIHEALV